MWSVDEDTDRSRMDLEEGGVEPPQSKVLRTLKAATNRCGPWRKRD
jgi:hypothetical protein